MFFYTSDSYLNATLNLIYILVSTTCLTKVCSFLNLVSLSKEILLSRDALVSKGLTVFPLHLTPHIYRSVCAVTHTSGISMAGSASNSSLSSLLGVMSVSWGEMADNNFAPITLVLSQWKKQWTRSAWTWPGHSLQSGVLLGRILDQFFSHSMGPPYPSVYA